MSKIFTTRGLDTTNQSFSQLAAGQHATTVNIKEDQPHA